MGEGWAAIAAGAVSLLGASVGGLAAITGAKIGAEKNATSVLQQATRQAHTERAQWVRDQRAAAYEQFLTAWDDHTKARGRFHFERPPTYDNFQKVQEFGGRLGTAAFRIRVVGPESVTDVAEQVLGRLTAMAIPGDVQAEWNAAPPSSARPMIFSSKTGWSGSPKRSSTGAPGISQSTCFLSGSAFCRLPLRLWMSHGIVDQHH